MTISIPCPQCGAILKLRDPSMLGRTGKCPKCAHRFPLHDPDEVEMELAESPAPSTSRGAAAPKLGTAAVWVPDDVQTPVAPHTSALAGSGPVLIETAEVPPPIGLKRKRQQKNLPRTLMLVGVGIVLLVGAVWGWNSFGSGQPRAADKQENQSAKSPEESSESAEESETADSQTADRAGQHEFGRPTHGQPIELLWVPSGARIVISLRPAELCKAGALGEGEFKAAFGPPGVWFEAWMKSELMSDPEQVEHAVIALIPGSRGTPPEVAAVVTRTAEHKYKKSELIDKFAGQAAGSGAAKYYTNDKRAMVLLPDMQTYAICPVSLGTEMMEASTSPRQTDLGIEELLRRTDRDLQLTLVCVPADLRIHGEFLLPPDAQPFLQNVADWISSDDEAEAVALSLHLTADKFYLQLLARNSAITKPNQLAKSFKSRLDGTPRRILEIVEQMNPAQLGNRKIIGRVPAMSKVVQLGTHVETENRLVSLSYVGPERAGPNLVVGTLKAWFESTRTNFSGTSATSDAATASRKSLKELLKTKIDIDFRRKPLEEAFDYIAGEAGFDIYVDGDALKAAGYTKNLVQTYKADNITAAAALRMVVTRPKQEQMCYVVDESKNLVTVTTITAANDKKLKIYEMK